MGKVIAVVTAVIVIFEICAGINFGTKFITDTNLLSWTMAIVWFVYFIFFFFAMYEMR